MNALLTTLIVIGILIILCMIAKNSYGQGQQNPS